MTSWRRRIFTHELDSLCKEFGIGKVKLRIGSKPYREVKGGGCYFFDSKEIFIKDGASEPWIWFVLLHEFRHAMQDQRRPSMADNRKNTCLAEVDADRWAIRQYYKRYSHLQENFLNRYMLKNHLDRQRKAYQPYYKLSDVLKKKPLVDTGEGPPYLYGSYLSYLAVA